MLLLSASALFLVLVFLGLVCHVVDIDALLAYSDAFLLLGFACLLCFLFAFALFLFLAFFLWPCALVDCREVYFSEYVECLLRFFVLLQSERFCLGFLLVFLRIVCCVVFNVFCSGLFFCRCGVWSISSSVFSRVAFCCSFLFLVCRQHVSGFCLFLFSAVVFCLRRDFVFSRGWVSSLFLFLRRFCCRLCLCCVWRVQTVCVSLLANLCEVDFPERFVLLFCVCCRCGGIVRLLYVERWFLLFLFVEEFVCLCAHGSVGAEFFLQSLILFVSELKVRIIGSFYTIFLLEEVSCCLDSYVQFSDCFV